jgi:hypothetical protein
MTNLSHSTNSNGRVSRRAVVASGALGVASLLATKPAFASITEDAELLELFEDWKVVLAACSGCEPDDGVHDDRCA